MKINKKDIEQAQQLWAKRIVDIGKAYLAKEDHRAVARKMINDLYGYKEGVVLFKPTKTSEKQFRLESAGALSYFISENAEYPEDQGFALQPWGNVRFENAGYILEKDYALVMGNYFFMDMNGKEIKVEYTLGYFRTGNGLLKINLHHSSLPYINR